MRGHCHLPSGGLQPQILMSLWWKWSSRVPVRAFFICELPKRGNRTEAEPSGAAMEEVVVHREACLAPTKQFLPCRDEYREGLQLSDSPSFALSFGKS